MVFNTHYLQGEVISLTLQIGVERKSLIIPPSKSHWGIILSYMTIEQTQNEIVEEFSELTDWMDRYAYIIDLGNTLPEFPETEKTPQNLIEGCQSRVWITASRDPQGNIEFQADSDAMIVKGIASLLLKVLSGHKPQEIIDADLFFVDKIGLSQHLSPTRSNGLLSMVKQIKNYARAFSILENK